MLYTIRKSSWKAAMAPMAELPMGFHPVRHQYNILIAHECAYVGVPAPALMYIIK